MLRKGSRASTSKEAQMAGYGSLHSPTGSFLLGSPRLFSKGSTDSESVMSPTSILDNKSFSAFVNPFWSDAIASSPKTPKPESKINWDKLEPRGVGLGLVDALSEENSDAKIVESDSRKVLLGSKFFIQIPPVISSVDSPKSPPEFGIKKRNSLVGPFSPGISPSPLKKFPLNSSNTGIDCARLPQVSEMELSEEYTCVISHGPSPRTTHIFDDCVVESCCGVCSRFSESIKEKNRCSANCSTSYPSEIFLSFCHCCKKDLGLVNDIYMYRGEKAFGSSECRCREMMMEKGNETPECDDLFFGATPP